MKSILAFYWLSLPSILSSPSHLLARLTRLRISCLLSSLWTEFPLLRSRRSRARSFDNSWCSQSSFSKCKWHSPLKLFSPLLFVCDSMPSWPGPSAVWLGLSLQRSVGRLHQSSWNLLQTLSFSSSWQWAAHWGLVHHLDWIWAPSWIHLSEWDALRL